MKQKRYKTVHLQRQPCEPHGCLEAVAGVGLLAHLAVDVRDEEQQVRAGLQRQRELDLELLQEGRLLFMIRDRGGVGNDQIAFGT